MGQNVDLASLHRSWVSVSLETTEKCFRFPTDLRNSNVRIGLDSDMKSFRSNDLVTAWRLSVRNWFACLVALLLVLAPSAVQSENVGAFTLNDHRGAVVNSGDFSSAKCLVVAFLGTECPLAKLYGPRLQTLANEFEPQGVKFLAINSNRQDSISEIAAYVKEHGIQFPVLKDPGQKVADKFQATRTPEVFVLSPAGEVLYQGRVDDQYLVGIPRNQPQREDLKLALTDILAGNPVNVRKTEPIGCLIGRIREPKTDSPVTWSNQIVRIVQKNCVECHRPGEIGPFSLLSYDDAQGWGDMIAEVVRDRRMPPWHADPAHGKFSNDRSLSSEDRDQILAWVKYGCPEGDKSQLPPAPTFTDGWQLSRKPDAVFKMRDKPFLIPASTGPEGVAYQYFAVDPKIRTDKWVSEMEVVPGNRAVVHHIIVYVLPEGKQQKGQGEFLCAYVPGARNKPLAPGYAKRIKAGSWLRFQVHYTPNGSPQEDLSQVGMIFTDDKSVTHQILTTEVINTRFELQPEQDNQTVTASSQPSPIDITMMSMAPHMHLRGKSFKYELETQDGQRTTLLDVPRYDFNWQTNYRLAEPILIPAGAKLHCTAVYDNSRNNPANPDPTKTVHWGDQSWDEMFLGYFDLIVPRSLTDKKVLKGGINVDTILGRFDTDKDGQISRDEAKGHEILSKGFPLADANQDGYLDKTELEKALERVRKAAR